ncbi:MAG TPA: NAD-glutamate dehydrogenase, partial [Burkholderiales bacterium]|nr:NAD-glutamate dehydrogenase [Burkholderiales bacterium]
MEARAKPRDSDLAEEFTRLYYAEVDPEELSARVDADLKGAAVAHLAFARRYSAGTAKARVYNPVRERDGWSSTHTVVEIVNDDMPFLVDSVAMEVNRQGLTLHLLVHPVLRVVRDASGDIRQVGKPGDFSEGRLESFMHVEVDRQTDPAKLAELEAGIARALADVRAAVADWKAMQERMREVVRR